MAARGIAGGEYALATSGMATHKHAAVRRGVPPRSSGIQGVEFFFVTSKALFCSAMYFAEACSKSVTVGTIKLRRHRGTRRTESFV